MIKIYTDGSYKSSTNTGGFGVAAFDDNKLIYVHREEEKDTTNNQMELKAIIHACNLISDTLIGEGSDFFKEEIIIYSDSSYCVNSINSWMHSWVNKDWINSKGEQIKNIELMKTLYYYFTQIFCKNQVKVEHLKGHDGDIGNELADALATGDSEKFSKIICEYNIDISSI